MYGSIHAPGASIAKKLSNEQNKEEIVVPSSSSVKSRVPIAILASLVTVFFLVALVYTPTPNSSSILSSISFKKSSSSSSSSSSSASGSSRGVVRTTYATISDEEKSELFAQFVVQYSKSYASDSSSEEYTTRFNNFCDMLYTIDARNTAEALADGEGIHGITKFADLTQEEFESMYLMTEYEGKTILEAQGVWRARATKEVAQIKMMKQANRKSRKTRGLRSLEDVEASYNDWTDLITTAVNDQGDGCSGGSWAFATAQQVESDSIRKGLLTTSDALSVQELLSCCTNSTGCVSGSVEAGYAYIQKGSSEAGAIHLASLYPYTATNNDAGECIASDEDYAITIGSSATVTKYHNELEGYTTTQVESNMLAHLVSTGTLHACLDASTWNTYESGTMYQCVGEAINHCVQVVGVNYDPEKDEGWYKIRNSWGADWGAAGFIYLTHGTNACDITYNPGYTDPTDNLGR